MVEQTVGFPWSLNSTTRIVIRRLQQASTVSTTAAASAFTSTPPDEWTLRVRVPEWAQADRRNVVTVNGAPIPSNAIVPGEYLSLRRLWIHGDVVEVRVRVLLLLFCVFRRVRTIPPDNHAARARVRQWCVCGHRRCLPHCMRGQIRRTAPPHGEP